MQARESALETEYIKRQEKELLQKLLARYAEAEDPKGEVSKTKLHVLCEKHGVKLTENLEAELRDWKNDGHFTPQYV